MSGEKGGNFFSKTTKVRCLNCKETILKQNYKTHLLRQHKEEDPNDIRELQQHSITNLFGARKSSSKRQLMAVHDNEQTTEIPKQVHVDNEDVTLTETSVVVEITERNPEESFGFASTPAAEEVNQQEAWKHHFEIYLILTEVTNLESPLEQVNSQKPSPVEIESL